MRELRPFIRLLRRERRWVMLGAALGLATVVAGIGLLALAGWFISATAFAGLSLATAHAFDIFRPGAAVRFFAIVRTAARYGERVLAHEATLRLLADLRAWFYRHLEPLAPARLMQYRSGDLLNRIVADIDALDTLYLRVLSPTAVALGASLLLLAFLWFFDPLIAAASFAFLLAAGFGVPALSGRLGARTGRELARRSAALRTRIVDGVQGLAELRVFRAHGPYLEALARDNRALLRDQARMSHIAGLAAALMTLLCGLAVWTGLYLAVDRVQHGALNGANLALVAFAVLAAFEAVTPLPAAYQYLGRTREAGRRLREIVDAEPPVRFPQRPAPPPRRFDLAFEGVSFRYRDGGAPVLQDLDFEVAEGRRVAILGRTGAGKSTLVHLLARFWDPAAGRIRLGGTDLRELDETDLRRAIAVVPQRVHVFNASIRDNLVLARPGATEAELRSALASAQLLDFVDSLPQGLDTWAGEFGTRLSGGEARRLAVARAILRDAPVLVLDEPAEGLDPLTEENMTVALQRLMQARTVLLITHRLTGLERMDHILLLERGRIVEQGDHASLIGGDTRYAALQAGLASWIGQP